MCGVGSLGTLSGGKGIVPGSKVYSWEGCEKYGSESESDSRDCENGSLDVVIKLRHDRNGSAGE
jgi:hypothetical protein